MGYVRSPGFVPGVIVGIAAVWAFHRFYRPMGTTPKAQARANGNG